MFFGEASRPNMMLLLAACCLCADNVRRCLVRVQHEAIKNTDRLCSSHHHTCTADKLEGGIEIIHLIRISRLGFRFIVASLCSRIVAVLDQRK